jgi:putative flippase GtrA
MGPRIRRWGIFNVVGFGGFILQLAAIALLTRYFEWSPAAATLVGVEIAFLHNFLGHMRWTWREFPVQTPREWLKRWWRYQLAKTGSLAANVAVTAALVSIAGLPVEAANIVAVGACAIPNFFIAEWFVVRNRCITRV